MTTRLRRGTIPTSCITSTPTVYRLKRRGCWLKTLPLFSKLSCPILTQPTLPMVQHVAGRIAPFPHSQHSPPPPLPPLACTRVRSNHHHNEELNHAIDNISWHSIQIIKLRTFAINQSESLFVKN